MGRFNRRSRTSRTEDAALGLQQMRRKRKLGFQAGLQTMRESRAAGHSRQGSSGGEEGEGPGGEDDDEGGTFGRCPATTLVRLGGGRCERRRRKQRRPSSARMLRPARGSQRTSRWTRRWEATKRWGGPAQVQALAAHGTGSTCSRAASVLGPEWRPSHRRAPRPRAPRKMPMRSEQLC